MLGYEAQIVMNLICQGINLLVITVATQPGAGGGVGKNTDQNLSFNVFKEHNSHDTSVLNRLIRRKLF